MTIIYGDRELTKQLSLARGTATVLVRELAGRQLMEELASPADIKVPRTRGRPTGVPSPAEASRFQAGTRKRAPLASPRPGCRGWCSG